MRKISIERIGQYLKTCIDIISENNNSISSADLIKEMKKRITDLNEIELEKTKKGGSRWITVFRFHTIGLAKGGYIKKVKNVWYLTDKGSKLKSINGKDLVNLSSEEYKNWIRENRPDEQGGISVEDLFNQIDENEEQFYDLSLSHMKIKPDTISFDEILTGVGKSLIQIPPFQREFVWSAKAIKELLDSIYRGYPIGSFIFWKTSMRLPRHRKIGGLKIADPPENITIDYVLDGQQRITSLYAAVRGAKIEDMHYKFYFDLSIGKFDYTKIDSNNENKDIFRVPLEKIFVDSPEYFRYVSKFPEKYQNILADLYSRFKQYSFSVIYVMEEETLKEGDNDIKKIVNIFTRINETGKRLTVVSKMIARSWGEDFDLREKLNELLYTEELETIREETILQIASVILNDKKSRYKNILEDTEIFELEEKWDDIIKSFSLALDFLKNKLRIKNFKYLPFDSIIVPLSYFHYKQSNPTNLQGEELFKWFWKACLSNRYSSTVESKIEEDCLKFDDLINNKKVEFNYPIDWEIFTLRLIQQNYYQRNAFCNTVLCLYSYLQPKNLKDNSDIDLVNNFSDYSKVNLHHFFPKAYLEDVDDSDKNSRDSIVNIAFAPSITNKEISKLPPADYIKIFSKENNNIKDTLKSHLISDIDSFGISSNNFGLFLEKRAERIKTEFRNLLDLSTKSERKFEDKPSEPIDEFEIIIRKLLDSVLLKEIGDDYWEEAMPIDIKMTVERKIEYALKKHPYEYKRLDQASEKINFLDMMDYQKIILSNWKIFSEIFGTKSEVQKHFSSLKDYRNIIKHVKPMDEVTKRSGEAALIWFENIFSNIEI